MLNLYDDLLWLIWILFIYVTWQSNWAAVHRWLEIRTQSTRLSRHRITLRFIHRETIDCSAACLRANYTTLVETLTLSPIRDCRDNLVDSQKLCTNNVYNNLTGTPPVIFVDNTFRNRFPAVTSSTVEPLSPPALRKRLLVGSANRNLVWNDDIHTSVPSLVVRPPQRRKPSSSLSRQSAVPSWTSDSLRRIQPLWTDRLFVSTVLATSISRLHQHELLQTHKSRDARIRLHTVQFRAQFL